MDDEKLRSEIFDLIELQTEGGYWDFKEMWNDQKTSLLHDIICMANNLENRDAYIIFGVRDSKDPKGFGIVGTNLDSDFRKDQEQLITFLRDKKFIGGIRPTVYLRTIMYSENIQLDVIIIKNSIKTPYYLSEKFEGVFANNIYVRIGDTNTPKDKSADIDKIEYLWKKRLGIDLSPFEKVKFLLEQTKDWLPMGTDGIHSSVGFEKQWFHTQYPEYTISYELDESAFDNGKIDTIESDIYWLNQLGRLLHNTYMYKLNVKYHSTVLYSTPLIMADNFRFNRVLWKHKYIEKDIIHYFRYAYIEQDHIDYLIDRWLNNSYETIPQTLEFNIIEPVEPWKSQPEYVAEYNPYCVVPVFKNSEEHILFGKFLVDNIEKLTDTLGLPPDAMCTNIEYIEYLCKTGKYIIKLLNEWRIKE